jgi:hypothetical protein
MWDLSVRTEWLFRRLFIRSFRVVTILTVNMVDGDDGTC